MDRRKFVKNGSLLSLAAMPLVNTMGNPLSSLSKENAINVGIIGYGSRGSGISKILNRHPGIKLLGFCDLLQFRLDKGKKSFPKAKIYKDYQEMLSDKNIDAVIISSPLNTHFEIAMAALDAKKHVYCEKTMTYEISESKKLVKKVKESDVTFQTGHQYRSTPLYHKIADMIQKGYIGEVNTIHAQWNRFGDWRKKVDKPENERVINWRMYREYSKGLMAELMSHQIDFCNWIFNAVPNQAQGHGSIAYWKDGRETYDNINAVFAYDKANLIVSSTISNAHLGYNLAFRGTEGTIVTTITSATLHAAKKKLPKLGEVDGVSGATISEWSKGNGVPIYQKEGEIEGWGNTDYALEQFIDNVNNKREPSSNVITGANTAVCVSKGVKAMITNKTQSWGQSDYIS